LDYVDTKLDELATELEAFRPAARAMHDELQTIFASVGAAFGGVNPITYRWADSRGNHHVQVEASNFKIPAIKKKKKGNFFAGKLCMTLSNSTDDGRNTWVKVTRQDPPNRAAGLWQWNPFSGAVTKRACVRYSHENVGLAACP
jgi:hypothetical protein